MSKLFNQLVKAYAETIIEFPQLKGITVAQWLLESGRGTSRLATAHLNFGGLKWRDGMEEFATPVKYEASDGKDEYCKFESLEKFIKGYWHFLERSPYEGWRNNVSSAEDFIRFIAPIYAGDSNYVSKVLNVYVEAKRLFADAEHINHHHPGTAEPVSKPPIKAFIQSPNHSSRAGADIDTIVVHYTTAGTVSGTIAHFKNPTSQVSAHYVIDKNGDIYQMVKDSDKAWHAANANRTTIGIEHVAKVGDRLTEMQEKSSIHLIKWLMTEYKIPKENIKAHQQIIPTSCPGNIFGDAIDDTNLPKFKAWVAKNFSKKVMRTPEPLSPSGLGLYIVQPGDTLSAIAARHDITLDALKALNSSIQNFNHIFPGQRITVARVEGDEHFIFPSSRPLNLPITIAEHQLNSSNYQEFSHPHLGNITITGGYMEPHGHSAKPEIKAIFLDGTSKILPKSERNIGIDYVASDRKVKAWYGGIVTKQGKEGGYGRRVHIQLDVTYEFQGKKYQVYQAFAHLQAISVSVGQVVGQGGQIGIMGGSGASSDNDYPLHVDLSTYLFINGNLVQLNPQALDKQLA
ncbi:N-acetylmuramoyl-L-alanine amidase [Microcoleus sp. FACHB-53]|nr:N-acetylmuramoyl-L-alanine amidase [Microcoleus sp. FACHB-53]MBD2125567.1 N-acetylmuramoyl-L-alanine amidase [Microcoleus sp. FACHB-1]